MATRADEALRPAAEDPGGPRRLSAHTKRPVFLNPLQTKLPVTATVSLAHRISGALLVLALPFTVAALERSLASAEGYARLAAVFGHPLMQLLLLLATWSVAHHVAAGVRHLLFDVGVGTRYGASRQSAWAVHAIALLATLAAALALWS
ncbi:succinate dehydrogenase, cytochrome b556 subunit [Caldimonas tepidiphila]|uniref:succinate dehydrogenase, cytochrome b556 subunit n=1 Tax=Caldimonas tepidiphila TaxID=2315841 RepID=UPI000E5AEC2A|nr:succinate dehydrogenase, cytochrome b556 subunit [Caldimonas tepidiphila]